MVGESRAGTGKVRDTGTTGNTGAFILLRQDRNS